MSEIAGMRRLAEAASGVSPSPLDSGGRDLVSADVSLRYGDIATELGATPIREAYERGDGKAFVLMMAKGAKVDVVFRMGFGGGESAELVLNGARLWLGVDGVKVLATNNSRLAIRDMAGVSFADESQGASAESFYAMERTKAVAVGGETALSLPLEDALGYGSNAFAKSAGGG
jgi:hypothetical protein